MPDNRATAVQILFQTFSRRSFLDFEPMNGLSPADRSFVKMLVMTTVRRYEFIRKVIRQFARKKLPPKAAYAQYALACAVCELLFMNTPDYAVINSCVNLVKKNCDRYVAGFVNAVLRKIAAEKELLKQHDKGEFFTPAQKAERDYIRKGNRLFNDSVFVDAEVNYRKALEVNPKSTVSMYNLGNTLSQQQKMQEAMEQYVSASNIEKDKMKLAQIYHNMGVLLQASKDYAKAVDAYKMSLRNNPADDETRYNLALAQKMLKDQQQNKQNQDQNQDQNKDQQKQDQKQDQNKDKQNDQKQDQKKDQQQPPKSEKQKNQMSKENAEQLLNSVMQDEKDVQDKVKKQQQVMQGGRLERDW